MAVATIKAVLDADLETVWNLVTSLDDYAWRRDIARISVMDNGRRFVEHTKDGYATSFTVTVFKPRSRYEFDLENGNMKGHWTGVFAQEDGKTVVELTEDISVKKRIMRPFLLPYLKKQQAAYIEDLRQALARWSA